jgi:hypothetical protein
MDSPDLIRRKVMRQINERILEVSRTCNIGHERLPFCCECGRPSCTDQLRLQPREFEAVPVRGGIFVLSPEHAPSVGAVVVGRFGSRAVLAATAPDRFNKVGRLIHRERICQGHGTRGRAPRREL